MPRGIYKRNIYHRQCISEGLRGMSKTIAHREKIRNKIQDIWDGKKIKNLDKIYLEYEEDFIKSQAIANRLKQLEREKYLKHNQ